MSRECSVTVLAQQASSQPFFNYSIAAEQNAAHKILVRLKPTSWLNNNRILISKPQTEKKIYYTSAMMSQQGIHPPLDFN